MDEILNQVKKQACEHVKWRCLYGFFYQGLKIGQLANIYCTGRKTISRWIATFKKFGALKRKQRDEVFLKFDQEKRKWLINLYDKTPILSLKEAARFFYLEFNQQISPSSISVILRSAGYSWKALERRAIQIQSSDIVRFTQEMNNLCWILENLVFLDECSFDNRDCLRKNGYGLVGKRLKYRGEFTRKKRVSTLCFLGINGLLECYSTEGTFDRLTFAKFCRQFILDSDSPVCTYPGKFSVWVLDGAKIHCDENLVMFLRSLGIIVIFLPAYCPFFMPIEIVFGLMKRDMQRRYLENSSCQIELTIAESFNTFKNYDMRAIFRHCGYLPNGQFNPKFGLDNGSKELGFTG